LIILYTKKPLVKNIRAGIAVLWFDIKYGGGAVGAYAKLYIRPSQGEVIHTAVSPTEDKSCCVCGRVSDNGKAVIGALALLYEAEGQQAKQLISAFVTDEDGEFAFGPLEHGQLYVIKVYKDSLKLRELEISV
jgi:hypothetical protein